MPILRITKDGLVLQEFEIQAERVTIGRDPENDVRLGDLTVSRRHGQLRLEASGRYFVENLQSRNGIRLNGHEITQPAALTDGDQLHIGVYELLFLNTTAVSRRQPDSDHPTPSQALLDIFGTMPQQIHPPAAAPPTNVLPVEKNKTAPPAANREEQEVEIGILINEDSNAIFKLDRDQVVLGNEGQVDIRVPGPERTRATISRSGEYFYLCSETATPCVSVNGRPVMNVRLMYNDRIEIGGRKFIFREI
jgi:pSer/pThr/pTyr-binding forkhead associated (FHA) protein